MYYKYYMKNLQMKTFIYNLCLLITSRNNHVLKIIGMQTNDTLILGNAKFLTKK